MDPINYDPISEEDLRGAFHEAKGRPLVAAIKVRMCDTLKFRYNKLSHHEVDTAVDRYLVRLLRAERI